MASALDYAQQKYPDFVEELKALLRIPSISTDSDYKKEMLHGAEWIADHCRSLGFQRVEIFQTPGHPIVYAEWLGAGDAPTVLTYGHYDVQPTGDESEWISPAFEPTERDGNLYARGAVDDKGQIFMHLKAFESIMQATSTFPVNLKLVIEGEEEIGSMNFPAFMKSHLDLLKADVVMISDTGFQAPGVPTICYGLRGIMVFEIEIFGPARELHSGSYGGTVHNPIKALVELLDAMHDVNGHIAIPGFYDDVRELGAAERVLFEKAGYTEAMWYEETGAPQPWGEAEFTIAERIGVRPTVEFNGIIGGYTGQGSKSVIPPKALGKLTCRLVPDQQPEKIKEVIRAFVAQNTPPTVRSEVRFIQGIADPVVVTLDSPAMKTAIKAYEEVFKSEVVFVRGGGSIGVVSDFQKLLGLDSVMMGFGLPDDNIHAPNEKFSLEQFRLGIETLIRFYQMLPANA